MDKKKALIIAASLKIGGAEKVARDISLYTPSEKYEFHYLVFGEAVGDYESQVFEQGHKVFHWAIPSDNYIRFFCNLLKLMRREKYHAVHAHTMFNCGVVMLAAVLAGVPVRISHAHSALNTNPGFLKRIYEKVMQWLILCCSTDYVACGVAAGERLFGRKAYQKRGNLILNGIDVQSFAFDEVKREQMRQQLQLQNSFVLGHAGHLAAVKNQGFLIELMPLILKQRPDTVLLLLGEGEDREKLEQRVREMHLEKHVILMGNVFNVADYLNAMDVFVFPSLYEGLPLSILEVQANGLPCVISDSVPKDVFLTDLLYPLSLQMSKEQWAETIFNLCRQEPTHYGELLQQTDYAVERSMEKIYRIYEKGLYND